MRLTSSHRVGALAAIALLLSVMKPAGAQFVTQSRIDEKVPRVGHTVVSWIAHRTDDATEHYLIRIRNDTTVPVAFTGARLSDCVNLATCDSVMPGPVVIAPGGITDLVTLSPLVPGKKTRFVQSPIWQIATDCVGLDTLPIGAVHPTVPITNRKVIVPPPAWPDIMNGRTDTLAFFINAAGTPDSVQVDGVPDQHYRDLLRQSAMAYVFAPARQGRCPVRGRVVIYQTFGKAARSGGGG